MLVEFEQLPEEARLWIYQSNRPFTEQELEEIIPSIENFLTTWTVHGADLLAGYLIKYKRFIIIGLNQDLNKASGCSIDASVRFIQELEKKYGVDLMDKMNVTFKQGEFIAYKPLSDFKLMAKNKSVSGNTVVFNNLVVNKADFEENWEVPASESWHSRFIK
ncbi:ABC transporter ATPase [Aegicerativicinus sediminis]